MNRTRIGFGKVPFQKWITKFADVTRVCADCCVVVARACVRGERNLATVLYRLSRDRRACPSLPGASPVPRDWHPCLSMSFLALRRQGAPSTLQFAGAVACLTNRRSKATRRLR